MTDVSKAIYAGDWELIERKNWVYLQDGYGTKIVLSAENARLIWRVLNCWVERNAPEVEVEE